MTRSGLPPVVRPTQTVVTNPAFLADPRRDDARGTATSDVMGLAVSVGIMAELDGDEEGKAFYRAELDRLSTALADEGVSWWEPDGYNVSRMRPHLAGFPYFYLAYLNRVMALVVEGRQVTPVTSYDDYERDRTFIEDASSLLSSHLLCHSDVEGFYVPVEPPDPLFFPREANVLGGGMVGSSQGLMQELRRCAPPLGINLDDGSLTDAEAARLFDLPTDADFGEESIVWLTLYEACRASIASGHAIVYG